jgi:CDP-2,3-bis-(O-geranylgeranyl)-sn-glycerol synthase
VAPAINDVPHAVLQALYFFAPAYLANMSPVLVRGLVPAWTAPIDGGRTLGGTRILGDHKTWRGLVAGIASGTLVFYLQQCAHAAGLFRELALIDYAQASCLLGFLMGLGTGVGDAVKSFFKRRIGIAPGASWLVFDQLDFMAGSYLFVALVYVPPLLPTLAILPIVFVGSVATSASGYWLGLKEAWI